jgi:myo-inositol 2-dehydrogenase/D-chiro-inositol 1-dehydrogenase
MDRTLTPTFWLKHWDGQQLHQVQFAKPTGEVYELHDQVAMLVRAVRDGGPLACSGEDGRQSVALCLAAQQSVETGGVVEFIGKSE